MTAPSKRRVSDRLLRLMFGDEMALGQVPVRQAPFTIVFLVALVFGLEVRGGPSRPAAVWIAAGLVIAVQLAGLLVPWRRLPTMAQIALPLGQLAALVLLDLGTSDQITLFAVLIFLPIVSLALLPSVWGVVAATLGAVSVVTVVAIASSMARSLVDAQSALVLLTAFLVAVGVHGMMAELRARRAEMHSSRDALSRSAERLRATGDLWRSLIEAATGHAIVATDADGRVEVFNQGAERLLGRSCDEAVGMDIADFYDPAEVAAALVDEGLENTPAGRETVLIGAAAFGGSWVHEWTYLRRDGEQVPVRVVVTRRPDQEGGTPGGYLFVATDVTEQRESERLQDEFIGLVSHELRTPLVSVLGYLDLLRLADPRLDDEQRQYLDTIDRNSKRLLRLVNDLLLSVELSAGKFTLAAEDVDATAITCNSVAAIRPAAEAAGIRIELDAPDQVRMRADPMRLAQLIENLLSNSVKFTSRGGQITVRVASRAGPGARPEVVISVADNGMGIAPDELDRITEPFFRTRSARNRRIRGTGLGLSITQAIVDAHHGEMSVQSELGSGTTFTVVIPESDRSPKSFTPPAQALTSPEGSSAKGGRC